MKKPKKKEEPVQESIQLGNVKKDFNFAEMLDDVTYISDPNQKQPQKRSNIRPSEGDSYEIVSPAVVQKDENSLGI